MRQPISLLLVLLTSCGSPATFNQDSTKLAAASGDNGKTVVAGAVVTHPSGDASASGTKPADPASPSEASAVGVVLTSIAITPGQPTIGTGGTQQFTATGTMSDGTTKDITAAVVWSLGTGGLLEFSDAANHPGLVKAVKDGTEGLTATLGTVTATVNVVVSPTALVSLAITTSPSLVVGAPAAIKVIGTYGDGHTADVTGQVDLSTNGAPATRGTSAAPGAGTTLTTMPDNTETLTVTTPGTTQITVSSGGVTGTVTVPVQSGLVCASAEQIVKSGSTTTLTWNGNGAGVTYTIVPSTATPPADIGSVAAGTSTATSKQAAYHAPATLTTSFDVKVIATPSDPAQQAGSCSLRLIADGAIGVPDNGNSKGPVGNVYLIPAGQQVNSTMLTASWFTQTPIANIVMSNFDVPNTPYEQGFPGFPSLTAWFAIRFEGQINIPTPGAYAFQLNADDGANFYLDGVQVVNNDGVHAITAKAGAPVQLTAGLHSFRLDYFEGPPIYLAIQLAWKGPNDSGFSIVPASYFSRPAN